MAICGRLVYLQIFSYGRFVKQAGHQQQRAIPLAAKRGVIYDRAGHELAMSVLVDSAFAVPTEVKDLPTAVSLITRITGDDYNVVLADCRAHKTFCWVARKASDETIERINSLKLQGIHFQKEPKRFYPARDLAAQVLGSVGMEDSGQSGIEHEFDDELRGRPGKMFISVDARKQWFSDVATQPDPGDNLVLTIDKNIQYIAERNEASRINCEAARRTTPGSSTNSRRLWQSIKSKNSPWNSFAAWLASPSRTAMFAPIPASQAALLARCNFWGEESSSVTRKPRRARRSAVAPVPDPISRAHRSRGRGGRNSCIFANARSERNRPSGVSR